MDKREALIQCLQGKKVRTNGWQKKDMFIYYDKRDHVFRFAGGERYYLDGTDEHNDSEWVIYEKIYNKTEAIKLMLDGQVFGNKEFDANYEYRFIGDKFVRDDIYETDLNKMPFDGWYEI